MLIILETGRRDLNRILIEQTANPQRAIQDFADIAFDAMYERHHQEFFHVQADQSRRHRVEFFAYETLGVAITSPRALAADFS